MRQRGAHATGGFCVIAMLRVVRRRIEEWQRAGCHWLDRMQSEIALWGELGSKLATTRSATEAFDAYAKCVAQQTKLTAEDRLRLLKDFQYMTQKVTQSLRGHQSSAGTLWYRI